MHAGFEVVIGLEVHVQLRTVSKMFCGCANRYGAEPNTLTCPTCLGLPGSLPVVNAEAVRQGIAFGLAVGAQIQPRSPFYRKQYFYQDLPKGYQITQGPVALVQGGTVEIPGDPEVRGGEGPLAIRLERAHLEEDSGKSVHDLDPGASLVDLNRAGVPLLEIVGCPDLRSPQEAFDYLKVLHHLVTYLGLCDGNMEEGSFRCDANISLRPMGETAFGTRVEIKNLNSFRYVKQALAFEVQRQAALLASGEAVVQETRGWDAAKGQTLAQRSKEEAQDYRYFPEPDLPVLAVDPALVDAVGATLPELPATRRDRFQMALGLTAYEAGMLTQSRAFADCFEEAARVGGNPKQAANWMLGEVSRTLNERGIGLEALGLRPDHLGELVALIDAGTLSVTLAKEQVFPALLAGEGSPRDIVAAKGLSQVSDPAAIEALVAGVLEAHPTQVAQVRAGQVKLKGFLVGQVMKVGKGKVNPTLVNEVLDRLLG